MLVTLQAVRVYESTSYTDAQNTPRLDPLHGQPIEIAPYLLDQAGIQGRVRVFLGAPVSSIVQASRIRQAAGQIFLKMFLGQHPGSDMDRAIARALMGIKTKAMWQADWYLTIVVEQDIEVPDHSILDRKYVWFVDDRYNRIRSFLAIASPLIDQIATLASIDLVPQVFEKMALTDRVFFSAPGRMPFGLPDGGGSAHLSQHTLLQQLDLGKLTSRLQASARLPAETHETLEAVGFWWLASLREEDQWRAFMHFFIGLELLHGQMGRRCYDRAVTGSRMQGSDQATRENTPVLNALLSKKKDTRGRIIPKGQLEDTDAGEFAAMSLALLAASADTDFEIFSRMKKLRNSVVHGSQRISTVHFPVHEIRDLLHRYLEAALDDGIEAPTVVL